MQAPLLQGRLFLLGQESVGSLNPKVKAVSKLNCDSLKNFAWVCVEH